MLKASNPTERPTELRAVCGCRFTPRSLVPEADEGVLELTFICVPHSQQRTKRIEEEEESSKTVLESVADAGYCHGCGFFDHGDAPCDLPPERVLQSGEALVVQEDGQSCERRSVRVEEGMWFSYCDTHGRPWDECLKPTCERVFAGYGIGGISHKCKRHQCSWLLDVSRCPAAGQELTCEQVSRHCGLEYPNYCRDCPNDGRLYRCAAHGCDWPAGEKVCSKRWGGIG